MDAIFNFYKEFIKLQDVLRTGWLVRGLNIERPENDSDHTLQTILLAQLLVKKYQLENINLLRVLEMLTIHDIGECIIGDIPLIDVDYQTKKQNERNAVKKELSRLGEKLSEYYFNLWCEFEDKTSREAIFAQFIDKIDGIVKAKVYESLTGKEGLFDEFYETSLPALEHNEFKPLLEELTRL